MPKTDKQKGRGLC